MLFEASASSVTTCFDGTKAVWCQRVASNFSVMTLFTHADGATVVERRTLGVGRPNAPYPRSPAPPLDLNRRGILFFATLYFATIQFALLYIDISKLPHFS